MSNWTEEEEEKYYNVSIESIELNVVSEEVFKELQWISIANVLFLRDLFLGVDTSVD